ncbi:catalytic [Ascochyta rabiei]|uniref:Catalytic n=1 Tax=Didymella rabiei TaxID=5454 RepID=A0A163L3C8_DIDRA|nr:catalytic [Ascochyta rabiei]
MQLTTPLTLGNFSFVISYTLKHSSYIEKTRRGDLTNLDSYAMILSWNHATNLEQCAPFLTINVGNQHAGQVWMDVLGFEWSAVTISKNGNGRFLCLRNSIACFVSEVADGREKFPVRFNADFHDLIA